MAGAPSQATQTHLPIAGIQDGVVLMNDGSIRAVLRIEPINFDLKSETVQNGIIYSYQAFLNSLDFPIQIVVQSKKLDLERYLIRLENAQRNITNDLLRIQVEDYVGFVRRLISVANIMSKRFFIVISYSSALKTTPTTQFGSLFHRKPSGPLMDQETFSRVRNEVFNRANVIGGGIGRLGVKTRLLDTQELIELFYGTYNPDVATEERLTDIDTLNSSVVHAPTAFAPQGLEPASQEQPAGQPDILAAAEALASAPLSSEPVVAPVNPQTGPLTPPADEPPAPLPEQPIPQPTQPAATQPQQPGATYQTPQL